MNLSGETKVREIALSNAGDRESLEKSEVDYCWGVTIPCAIHAHNRPSF